MALGGNVPPLKDSQRTSDASLVLRALKAMANSEEKAVLMCQPPDAAHALLIANALTRLMLDRIEDAFVASGAKVPPGLKNVLGHTSSLPPPLSLVLGPV